MSQHNGVSSSLASIEAAPPIHGTQSATTISHSHPSTPSALATISLSSAPQASNLSRTGTKSSRVHIPKLSAATTELLARLAGNIREAQQPALQRDDQPSVSLRPLGSNGNIQYTNFRGAGKMRVSSTLIELPTAPFVYQPRVEAPVITPSPAVAPLQPSPSVNGVSAGFPGLANIAPKPVTYPPTLPALAPAPGPPVPADMQQPTPPPPRATGSRPAPIVLKFSNPAIFQSLRSLNVSTPKPSIATFLKPASAPHQGRSAGSRKSGSKKRKRGPGSDGEDIIRAVDSSSDESESAPTATQTKSGRQVNRPLAYVPSPPSIATPTQGSNLSRASENPSENNRARKRAPRKGKNTNIICKFCQRGHSPSNNAIVFCDGCNRAWHQHCHDPLIKNDVVMVKDREWFCQECRPVGIVILHPTVVRSNPGLPSGSPVHPPLTIPNIEVGGGQFPSDDRRRFLSGLSHATLVELLLAVSDQQPTIPMFPEDMKSLPSSKFLMSQSITCTTTTTPTALPPGSMHNSSIADPANSIGISGDGLEANPSTDLAAQRKRGRYHEESSDDDSEYEFQEHRLYPRAGNGIQLSIDEEDLDILREDPACPTFSYALHSPSTQIASNVSI
ncbi:hypothetical protein BJX70DRAFT_372429 [Aspergillus crustosus]